MTSRGSKSKANITKRLVRNRSREKRTARKYRTPFGTSVKSTLQSPASSRTVVKQQHDQYQDEDQRRTSIASKGVRSQTQNKKRNNYLSADGFFRLPDLSKVPRHVASSCFVYGRYRLQNHILGTGSYGKVMIACEGSECKKVGKIIKFDFSRYPVKYVYNLFFAECLMTQFAGVHEFGIPVHSYTLCWDTSQKTTDSSDNPSDNSSSSKKHDSNSTPIKGLIIMDKFDGDLNSINAKLNMDIMQQVFQKIKIMHNYGIFHRDLFLRNVMYKSTGDSISVRIIDFGLAIPLGQAIPSPFQAIDYLNVIKHIDNI